MIRGMQICSHSSPLRVLSVCGSDAETNPQGESVQTTSSASHLDIASILSPKKLPCDVASAQKNLPARNTNRPITKMNETQVRFFFNSVVSAFVTSNKAA